MRVASWVFVLLTACHSPLFEHANAPRPEGLPLERGELKCMLEFPTHGLCASIEWKTVLSDSEPVAFTLRFWESDALTTPSDTPYVKLWMPSMGHGSAEVTLEPKEPGVYAGSEAYFVMPGEWEVKVQLRRGAQVVEEASIRVQIP